MHFWRLRFVGMADTALMSVSVELIQIGEAFPQDGNSERNHIIVGCQLQHTIQIGALVVLESQVPDKGVKAGRRWAATKLVLDVLPGVAPEVGVAIIRDADVYVAFGL